MCKRYYSLSSCSRRRSTFHGRNPLARKTSSRGSLAGAVRAPLRLTSTVRASLRRHRGLSVQSGKHLWWGFFLRRDAPRLSKEELRVALCNVLDVVRVSPG